MVNPAEQKNTEQDENNIRVEFVRKFLNGRKLIVVDHVDGNQLYHSLDVYLSTIKVSCELDILSHFEFIKLYHPENLTQLRQLNEKKNLGIIFHVSSDPNNIFFTKLALNCFTAGIPTSVNFNWLADSPAKTELKANYSDFLVMRGGRNYKQETTFGLARQFQTQREKYE